MTRMKKISKKKLKEHDEFISLTEKGYFFITQHFKPIILGVIVLCIIISSIFLYQKWSKGREEEAYRKFILAMGIYTMASSPYREESPSELKSIIEKFNEVIIKYPNTSSGKLSLLYKGNLYLHLSQFDEAIRSYQAFLKKGGEGKLTRLFAMEGLGNAFEGKKDYDMALQSYQKIIQEDEESFPVTNIYLNIARCYEKLGKNKEALGNYRAFLKGPQKSMMTGVVLRKISILENSTR